jgi:hypothetical protein
MPLYVHARQFPHLAGRSDPAIRTLARRAMARRPWMLWVLRLRNVSVFAGMIAAIMLLRWSGRPGGGGVMQGFGFAMMAAGAGATAFVLFWNLVWINTVLYRVTQDEVQRPDAEQRPGSDGG